MFFIQIKAKVVAHRAKITTLLLRGDKGGDENGAFIILAPASFIQNVSGTRLVRDLSIRFVCFSQSDFSTIDVFLYPQSSSS